MEQQGTGRRLREKDWRGAGNLHQSKKTDKGSGANQKTMEEFEETSGQNTGNKEGASGIGAFLNCITLSSKDGGGERRDSSTS